MEKETRIKKKKSPEKRTEDKNIEEQMLNTGKRIRVFRQLVGLSRHQLALMLNKKTSCLKNIETGKQFPDIYDLFILTKKFGLSANWVSTGKDEMFVEKRPRTNGNVFFTGNHIDYKNPNLLQYAELYNLMKFFLPGT